MSIIIKGMEMPSSCGDCRFCGGIADTDCGPCAWCDVDGKARVADTRQDCPLVPVPEPHGDLIDRKELENVVEQFCLEDEHGDLHWWNALMNAPTVIPSSKEECV